MGDRRNAALANAAGSGTIAGLHEALKGRMALVAASFDGLNTKTGFRAPQVLDGWLPPKAGVNDEEFPFVLVRPSEGTDTEEGADQHAEAKVKIVIGTLSDTDDGWLDLVQIIDAIRDDLGAQPAIHGTGFEQVGPLQWEIPDEQPRPEWIGTVTTNWIIPRPRRVEARNPMSEE